MNSKLFLDAGVLLDLILKRDDFASTEELFNEIIAGNAEAYIVPSALHIVAHWTERAYGPDKAKAILLKLLAEVTVIDSTDEVAVMALHSRIKDVDDALSYYTALHHDVDAFISNDAGLKKAAISRLPVYSAKEILELAGQS